MLRLREALPTTTAVKVGVRGVPDGETVLTGGDTALVGGYGEEPYAPDASTDERKGGRGG